MYVQFVHRLISWYFKSQFSSNGMVVTNDYNSNWDEHVSDDAKIKHVNRDDVSPALGSGRLFPASGRVLSYRDA
jgi:hypothetical protein